REKARSHKHQPERHPRSGELTAQFLRPLLQGGLVKITGPMAGNRKLVSHVTNEYIPGPDISQPNRTLGACPSPGTETFNKRAAPNIPTPCLVERCCARDGHAPKITG